ncbi:MAG: amidohydrolase [Oscillospiraceae bacterium]|nr:amidohydrolase [Oscillospiraceae bacterium]
MSIAADRIDQKRDYYVSFAKAMWEEPETAYKEVKACRMTARALEELGFTVETGAYGLPTCVVGRYGSGKPVIGFLGELDALPGMSQKCQTTKEPAVPGAPGQACGHNLLNTAALAAAAGAAAELKEKGLPGTVVFYGCPAEEELTGKSFMARNGAFSELDAAYAWHGNRHNEVPVGKYTGLNSAIFHFTGRTAHAGGDPHNGRSGLDACELMSVGANYLREHVTSDVRIHYCYKEAGTAPNIVPDKGSVWYYVRALSREAVEDTYDRLVLVAKGAALMTQTELEVEFLGGCYDTMPNLVLAEQTTRLMRSIGAPEWTAEELEFADELNRTCSQYEALKAAGALAGGPMSTGVLDPRPDIGYGSTDVGDVQHIVPCIMVNTATYDLAAAGHSWQIAACAGSSIGFKGMLFGAKVLAEAAVELVEKPELLEAAKEEFKASMKGKTYKCPIPEGLPVPQPDGTKK